MPPAQRTMEGHTQPERHTRTTANSVCNISTHYCAGPSTRHLSSELLSLTDGLSGVADISCCPPPPSWSLSSELPSAPVRTQLHLALPPAPDDYDNSGNRSGEDLDDCSDNDLGNSLDSGSGNKSRNGSGDHVMFSASATRNTAARHQDKCPVRSCNDLIPTTIAGRLQYLLTEKKKKKPKKTPQHEWDRHLESINLEICS